MTLHMVQLNPNVPRLARWAAAQRLLAPDGNDDLGYALHALLLAGFDRLAPKPFVLLSDGHRAPKLLAYSAHPASGLRERAQSFADPDVMLALSLDTLADKIMPQYFPRGRHLGFRVRVRPVLRTDRDGDRNRVREIDAFLAAALRAPGEPLDRGQIYSEWLSRHLSDGGARPVSLVLQAFRRSRVLRRRRDGESRPLASQEGPDATFEGVLEVTDPEAFDALLARGVGRHRAFGFGMLLLRPA